MERAEAERTDAYSGHTLTRKGADKIERPDLVRDVSTRKKKFDGLPLQTSDEELESTA